ncbi:MAG TPA: TOBE domain-containing protein [Acidimicrobiales bacterium]|nr:TOBE domain-containing protein [Acidimicrobiales bacterium]
MAQYRPGQLVDLLGVSADTVRRWCDEGRLETARSEGGHRMVDGASVARFVREQQEAHTPEQLLTQSARNRFSGIVTRVERDVLTAIIEIRAGRFRIVSLLTREAADDLQLQEGDLATAVVKSTSVMVEVPLT